MDESITTLPIPPAGEFELGEVLGRRRAFGAIAGRCSAANAACIRRVRDEKLFTHRAASWDEFCPKYLGMSKTQANRIIHLLDEFGPDYFELTQSTRIPAEEYRAIAPAVKDNAIHVNGEAIALIPENTERVAAAVADLRRAAASEPEGQPPARAGLAALVRRSRAVAAEFAELSSAGPGSEDGELLLAALREMRTALARVEEQMTVWGVAREKAAAQGAKTAAGKPVRPRKSAPLF